MAENIDAAIDTLIQRGWSDEDIGTVIDQVNQQTDNLIKQGKKDEEISSFLSTIKMKDKSGDFQLFQPAVKGTKLADVKEPTMMEKIASGPVGGAVEKVLKATSTAAPFGPLIRGEIPKATLSDVGNTLVPEAIADPIKRVLSGIRGTKITVPGTNIEIDGHQIAKVIEDSMASTPVLHGAFGPTISNLRLYGRNKNPTINVDTLKDVTPVPEPPKTSISGPGIVPTRPKSPITGGEIQGQALSPTVPESSIIGQTSTPSKIGGTNLPALITDPQFLDEVKQVRRIGIANGDVELINYTSKILEENNVTDYVPRGSNLTQQLSQPTPEVTINIAKEARKFGEETNDPVLVERANRAINNVGIVKPIEIAETKRLVERPDPGAIKEATEAAADANIVAATKPEVDLAILADTAVKDITGLPKTVYHGTPVAFKEFDVAKSAEGLYGKGIYFTEEPTIAGGTGIPTVKTQGKAVFREENLGYASNRKSIESLKKEMAIWEKDLRDELASPTGKHLEVVKDLQKTIQEYRNQIAEAEKNAPNVRPVYLNIKNPFDMDAKLNTSEVANIINVFKQTPEYQSSVGYISARQKVADFVEDIEHVIARLPDETYDAWDLYDNMVHYFRTKDDLNSMLKAAGYDGITHTGGAITGHPPHKVWIAFSENQIISKFDPILFKQTMNEVTAEPTITMRKAASNPKTAFSDGKTDYNDTQALDNIDVPKETPQEIAVGNRIVDAALANKVDGLSSLTDNPAKYFSDEVKNKNRNPDGSLPPPMQGEMVTSNPPPAIPPLAVQLMRRWLPFYRIANKIEADTKIPVMTELYVKGRIASNQDIEFKLEKQAQLDKIFGDYTSPRQKYREANDRMSEAMENVLDYDSKTGEITWKDSSGVGHTGNIAQAARDLGIPVKEVEIVGKVREFFTDSFTDTGLEFDKFAMFYLPRRWRSNPEERFKYMSQFREDQQPFFSYRKAGGNQPRELETNLYNLANIYVNEWAKTKYLMPWKKEVADPILDKIVKYPQGASSVPLSYVGHYVEDIMGIPRTGAVEFNYTVGNWIERVGQKHPELAETLYTWLSRDRPGEILGSKLLKLQYQGALGFRIWPAIRNATQRGFAIPLMPGGVKDLVYGRAKMATKDGHDILQLSGVYGYLGDLVDRHAVANSRWYHPLTTYQSIENANRGSIYLSQYYHLIDDLKNGMTVGRIADKYKFHLFPESLQNHWKELIKNKQYGDIREVGLINNAVHSIADWTQLITQFPYDKGGGAEITKTGPIVKQAAAFNSWNLFTADYMTNLLADAARKSRPKYVDGVKVSSGSYKDLANVAKMFAIFMVADRLSDHFFGASIGSTPIANLPTKLFESPTMTLAKSAQQVVAGETDKLMSNIILGRENEYAAMEAKEGWRKLKSTLPVFIPGGLLMRDISRAIQSGDPTRAIIPKPKEQKKPPSDISAE